MTDESLPTPGTGMTHTRRRNEAALTLTEFLLARITEDQRDARGYSDDDILGTWTRYSLGVANAMRQIVALHTIREVSPSCSECGGYTVTPDDLRGAVHHGYATPWPCPTLRALASVYAAHPDYREEWKP